MNDLVQISLWLGTYVGWQYAKQFHSDLVIIAKPGAKFTVQVVYKLCSVVDLIVVASRSTCHVGPVNVPCSDTWHGDIFPHFFAICCASLYQSTCSLPMFALRSVIFFFVSSIMLYAEAMSISLFCNLVVIPLNNWRQFFTTTKAIINSGFCSKASNPCALTVVSLSLASSTFHSLNPRVLPTLIQDKDEAKR